MELPSCILIDPTVALCREIEVREDGPSICLRMETIQPSAACPKCARSSTRVHSHYRRQLADLPWASVPVTLEVHVRRFFCDNPECARQIFSERMSTVAQAWARRTQRLAKVQQKIGLVAGGSAGAELCQTLGCPAQVDVLLYLVRTLEVPEAPTPRVLGVDDWAKRKGQTYGTILIDHERGCVVDVLADRAPETLAQWLREHPGVEIVTRDRAEAYAQGIRDGAPAARQVADRWHLLKNLTETITKIFNDHQRAIQQQFRQIASSSEPASLARTEQTGDTTPETPEIQPENEAVAPGGTGDDPPSETAAAKSRQHRAAEAHMLRQRGWHIKAIARHLNCHPKTIRRYLQRQLPLAAGAAKRQTKLDGFKSYVLKRWNEGCHNASQLYREIRPQGYEGRITALRVHLATLRRASGIPAYSRQSGGRTIAPDELKRPPSCRHLAWLTAQSAERLDDEDQQALKVVSEINAPLKTAVDIAQRFAAMVCQHQPGPLDEWLEQAKACELPALRSFANGLQNDYEAVRAALTLTYSNGRTEGHVNRLKCLKRQMYGRGGLDLLRRRVMTT